MKSRRVALDGRRRDVRRADRIDSQQRRVAEQDVEDRKHHVGILGMEPQAHPNRDLAGRRLEQILQRAAFRIVAAARHHPVAGFQLVFGREHEPAELGDDLELLDRGVLDRQDVRVRGNEFARLPDRWRD